MADAELIRHQQSWQSFTTFVKVGTISVLILVALLFGFVWHA
jgi:Bacterial aa3 type cytochrome c oxidase subunit IV